MYFRKQVPDILIILPGKHGYAPRSHHKAAIDPRRFLIRIAVFSIAVTVSVDIQMPCTTSVKIRQSDRNIFPESIDRNIDQIIVSLSLPIALS